MNQMKCSYSMSSLESPQKVLRTPEGPKKPSRHCNSLNSKKPRRTLDKKMWRRSWGSSEETQEEVWKAYHKCAQGIDDEVGVSLREFLEDYTTVCDWLNAAQVERGRFTEVEKLSELGAELVKKQPWRVKINETAKSLLKMYPNLKEEFQWRLKHLNSQWDALEKILLCQSATVSNDAIMKNANDDTGGIEWLREWLREMENQLQPLEFRTQWTFDRLEYEIIRHKDLQGEIEKNSSKVHEALRQFGVRETSKKSRLETRWLQLRLRVLEWVQHLSGIQDKLKQTNQAKNDNFSKASVWSSDEETSEPLNKYRRLGSGIGSGDTGCVTKAKVSVGPSVEVDGIEGVEAIDVDNQLVPVVVPSPPPQQINQSLNEAIQFGDCYSAPIFVLDSGHLKRDTKEKRPRLSCSGIRVLDLDTKEGRNSGSEQEVVDIDLDLSLDPDVEFDEMGQSHDSEGVFNQTGSPISNSVVEFIFDESHRNNNILTQSSGSTSSINSTVSTSASSTNSCSGSGSGGSTGTGTSSGLKRKLNSKPTSPSKYFDKLDLEQLENLDKFDPHGFQQVPLNISTYYFKHSDTEAELNQNQILKLNSNQNNHSASFCSEECEEECLCSDRNVPVCTSTPVCKNNCKSKSPTTSPNSNKGMRPCQLALDLGQKSNRRGNGCKSSKSGDDEISLGSDVELDAGDEVMMDLEVEDREAADCQSSDSFEALNINTNTANINTKVALNLEISELVQQAELLAKKSARSRGVCVDILNGPLFTQDDEVDIEDKPHSQRRWQKPLGDQLANLCKIATASSVAKSRKHQSKRKSSCGSGSFVSSSGSCGNICGSSFATLAAKYSSQFGNGIRTTMEMEEAIVSISNKGSKGSSSNYSGQTAIRTFAGESESAAPTNATALTGRKTKKSSRVRKWVREHNGNPNSANQEGVKIQPNTSSCDASAESTSEDEEVSSSCSEHLSSSDDPTTTLSLAASTSVLLQQTQQALGALGVSRLSKNPLSSSYSSSSQTNLKHSLLNYPYPVERRYLNQTLPSNCGGVTLRTKKRSGKQRPKSFTEALGQSQSHKFKQSWGLSSSQSQNCFVSSDTALNLLGNNFHYKCQSGSWSGSHCNSGVAGGVGSPKNYQSNSNSDSSNSNSRKKSLRDRVVRKRLFRNKRKSVNDVSEGQEGLEERNEGVQRSSSFLGAIISSGCDNSNTRVPPDQLDAKENKENESEIKSPPQPKPNFQILGPVSQPASIVPPNNSDNGSSMNTDGLHSEQDWDSYQEKYLSEPYSEEPYDPNDTLKLLAFGEDYGQYLDRPDSESSSVLSGFEPQNPNNLRKRRPLLVSNRSEMPESDSDREELNHLLSQSAAQLRFIDAVFRKQMSSSSEKFGCGSPAEFAEMEATCDENISSLQLILSNIEHRDSLLPFEVDVKNIEGVLEKWHILKEKIRQAARLHQIREEMDDLKSDFSSVQSHFEDVDPFDANDLGCLQDKIGYIQQVLLELSERKQKLQSLNEASLGTQLFLKDTNAVSVIKEQLQELYALYEENFQLGSYLLDKMRFLQDAWEKFEAEKSEFERSISVGNLRSRLRKDLSSAASTDSGHGTDASHDSSVSDSDLDFQERKQKLAALKKRACEIKSFLPPGSPVMEVIDQRVFEAEKGLEDLRKSSEVEPAFDLKIIYPKKKSSISNRRSPTSSTKSLRLGSSHSKDSKSKSSTAVKPARKWKIVHRMVVFNFTLMGLFLAAAYFLHPKCCEFSNTFCFSLVPHLTHESLPPI